MKTASSLMLVALGLILALAVRGHPAFLNIQVVGWVIVLTGVAGMFIPKRGYGWLRRRMVVRRGATGRPVVNRVEETRYPPYVMLNSGTTPGTTVVADAQAPGDGAPTIVDEVPVTPAEPVRIVHPDAQLRADEKAAADWQAAERAMTEWEAVEDATPPGAPLPTHAVVEEYVEE
jgi:hypothetical protein